jgi:zinc protease
MKPFLFKLTLPGLLAVVLSSCASLPGTHSEPGIIETLQTPAGHSYSYHHMPQSSRAAVAISWRGGFAGVENGKENIAFFGPHMMTEGGADGTSPVDLVAEFEALDAGARLYSEDDSIRGFIVAPSADFPTAATIANKVLAKPTMDKRWLARFKRERKTLKAERQATVVGQAWHTLRQSVIGQHRLQQAWSWTSIPKMESISIDDIRDWHQTHLSSNDAIIAVAGNIAPDAAAAAIDTALQGLPSEHKRQNFNPITLTFNGKTILVHRPNAEKSYLLISGPLPPASHPNDLSHSLGVGVLGEGQHSRLFKTVRTEQRAAYGFAARKYAFTRVGDVLALEGEVETAKIPAVIAAVESAYKRFVESGIGPVEFPIAHRIMKKRTREATAKPSTIAYLMTESVMRNRPQTDAITLRTRVAALDRDGVNAAIKESFPAFDDMLRIVVSPDRDIVAADCIINDFREFDSCR